MSINVSARRLEDGFVDGERVGLAGLPGYAELRVCTQCTLFTALFKAETCRYGALAALPFALNTLTFAFRFEGDLAVAALLIEEAEAINEATGSNRSPYAAGHRAALRAHEAEAPALIEAHIKDSTVKAHGAAVASAQWATATLYNGLGL